MRPLQGWSLALYEGEHFWADFYMNTPPKYVPLERLKVPRPVHRIPYIVRQCTGLNVLDLGAMDETAFKSKRGKGYWLHEELSASARSVIGIDSSELIPSDGLQTYPNARIIRGGISDLAHCLQCADIVPDIVVAGELIEHLESPVQFLRSIRSQRKLLGKRLIFTTPNATAIHNCLIALLGMESTHHDHLSILSYKTLWTNLDRAGFRDWVITPYCSSFSEMKLRNTGLGGAAIRVAERAVNAFEWCFPLMSFGYIVTAEI